MVFKNSCAPNIATGGQFKQSTAGFTPWKSASLSVSNKKINGLNTIKIDTLGTVVGEGVNIFDSLVPVMPGGQYTISLKAVGVGSVQAWIYERTSSKTGVGTLYSQIVSLSPVIPTYFQFTKVISSTAVYLDIYLNTATSAQATTFYATQYQVELGSTATAYEFPGIDLTGNSIPSNEQVQNLKLNQMLKMFNISSNENVPNLTVENILKLLNVPSSEYVNNLEICNSIFMEAIESTETVNELIAWVACEFIKCNITMKTPKTVLSMKYPR